MIWEMPVRWSPSRPGYGRNYLIPRGLAIPASEGSVRELDHQKRVAEAIRRKRLDGLPAAHWQRNSRPYAGVDSSGDRRRREAVWVSDQPRHR